MTANSLMSATHARMGIKYPPKVHDGLVMHGLRRAATLIEMTFVLIIIVAIIVGALVIASNVMNQNTTSEELQTVSNLSAAVRKVKSNRGYPSDIEGEMRTLHLFPDNVVDTGTALANSWGGTIEFAQIDSGANFSLSYTNIPKRECTALVLAVKPGILQSVGAGTTATVNIIDLTAATIDTTICADDGNNDVTWSSKVQG